MLQLSYYHYHHNIKNRFRSRKITEILTVGNRDLTYDQTGFVNAQKTLRKWKIRGRLDNNISRININMENLRRHKSEKLNLNYRRIKDKYNASQTAKVRTTATFSIYIYNYSGRHTVSQIHLVIDDKIQQMSPCLVVTDCLALHNSARHWLKT